MRDWNEYYEAIRLILSPPKGIEPPCTTCKYWHPVLYGIEQGLGMRLCHNDKEQEKDFSCFRAR